MEVMLDLIGRFHPLVVHLPIGFLVLGTMMLFYSRNDRSALPLLRFSFFWGSISTLFALLTGLIQYQREGFAWESVLPHLIAGLLCAGVAFSLYFVLKKIAFPWNPIVKTLSIALLLLLILTGHLGGNLTHGEGHLTEPLPEAVKERLGLAPTFKKVEFNPDEFADQPLYTQVIQPLFDAKCVSCHNPTKNKGELVLTEYKTLIAGGKNGAVLATRQGDKSPLVDRILLPLTEKKHMPPKAKIQLTEEEKELISLWVKTGASPTKVISTYSIDERLFRGFFPEDKTGIYPNLELVPLTQEVLVPLLEKRLLVSPLYDGSPLLLVSCVNFSDFSDGDLLEFEAIKEHLVALDLGKTKVTDAAFEALATFPNLTTLTLDHTNITGYGIEKLQSLPYLKRINLSNSNFDIEYLPALFEFSQLEQVHLYPIDQNENIRALIPDSHRSLFTLGTYEIALKERDTLVY